MVYIFINAKFVLGVGYVIVGNVLLGLVGCGIYSDCHEN